MICVNTKQVCKNGLTYEFVDQSETDKLSASPPSAASAASGGGGSGGGAAAAATATGGTGVVVVRKIQLNSKILNRSIDGYKLLQNTDKIAIPKRSASSVAAAAAAAPAITTNVEVVTGDCLDCGESLLRAGYNPCVLNMANAYVPGGGWLAGDGAQEENMFRRSTYHMVLQGKGYPLQYSAVCYTPAILCFRSNEATGYRLLSEPFPMAFIACAAERGPRLIYKSMCVWFWFLLSLVPR